MLGFNCFRLGSLAVLIAIANLSQTLSAPAAVNCPFCSAVNRTFSEQIDSSDVVIIGQLIEAPYAADEASLPKGEFRATEILKGHEAIAKNTEFNAIVVGNHKIGDRFLLMGSGIVDINWSTPLKTSDRVIDYLRQLELLPEKGGERLEFFVGYFEDQESVLAYDAYDEFARAPYEDVKSLKDKLDRKQLKAWLLDPDVMKSRKRLYYTLLGVCGTEEDIPFLEQLLESEDREKRAGLDALIACYLTLKGDDGVNVIEKLFLGNQEAEYIDTFSAIQALRFHGTESDRVSTERIVAALRQVLDRPKMADMVIPDLARWEDWSVMERLVKMFKEANTDETNWVRTPIISYLQACPKPEAKKHIAALREIDPDAVRRAEMLSEFNWDDEEDTADDGDGDDAGGAKTDADGTDKKTDKKDGDGDDLSSSGLPAESSVATVTVPAKLANHTGTGYVSTTSVPGSSQTLLTDGGGEAELTRTAQASMPVASTTPGVGLRLAIIFVPVAACLLLFLLLWSVLSGWFERLIF